MFPSADEEQKEEAKAACLTDTGADPPSELNHTQPSLDCSDAQTPNGSQQQAEPVCNDSSSDAAPSGPAAAERPLYAAEDDELEREKLGEACSPCSPANQQPAKRRACRKRRRSLFTIQAVNSNGTTERGTGDGGSAVSFSCMFTHTHTHPHTGPVLLVLKAGASVYSSAVRGHRLGP